MQGSKDVKVPVTVEVSEQRIADLLVNGLETAIHYWSSGISGMKKATEPMRFRTDVEQVFKHVDYPMNDGFITVEVNDECADAVGREHRLDRKAIEHGLKTMAEIQPGHFGDWLSQNDDADTADVFIQCCLFGKVVFG